MTLPGRAAPAPSPVPGLPPLLRMLIALACLVVIVAGIKVVAPILTTFLLALLLAQVMSPLLLFLMHRGLPRGVAVTVTLLLVLVGGAAVIALVGVSVSELSRRLPQYGAELVVIRDQLFTFLQGHGIDTAGLTRLEALDPTTLVRPAASMVGALLAQLGHGFFILLITALLLIELAVLFRELERADRSQRTLLVRFGEMSTDVQKYIAITALVGLVGTVAYAILLQALGVPFIAAWVVLYFLLSFIPAIGGVISLIPVVIVTVLEHGLERAVILVVIFTVFNFLLGDVLKPRFVQKGFEISIVAIFAALVFWDWLLGPVGMVLAVPLTITLRKLLQEFAIDVRRAVFE